MQSADLTGNEAAIHDVRYELTKVGFTLATVNPTANTMLMEYHVMDVNDSGWSKENFTTLIAGFSP
jgi:hypothetical protein